MVATETCEQRICTSALNHHKQHAAPPQPTTTPDDV